MNKIPIIDYEKHLGKIEYFNEIDSEPVQNSISNESCWKWMRENIPWFECPDQEMDLMYYFRWWVYRKHIKKTPAGYVITEFLPPVNHAQKYNTIVCSSGLHIEEGRWIKNRDYITDYINFFFSGEVNPRHYSTWLACAVEKFCVTKGDFSLGFRILPRLVENYLAWEESNRHETGSFWSNDDRDGGEYSINGSGLRPTLNSYLYGEALAISRISDRSGMIELAGRFGDKAAELKKLEQSKLWDREMNFFACFPLEQRNGSVGNFSFSEIDESRRVREIYGYLPWKFNLPDEGFETAWKELSDSRGFSAPYGPTTAEQRHPLFMKNRIKRCQWDGSSWPFATSMTCGALIQLLRNYDQHIVGKEDFYQLMKTYTQSQFRILPYGDKIPWIGESLHPHSSIWLSRAIAMEETIPLVKKKSALSDLNQLAIRGKDYNHSSYCDLIISGIVGLDIDDQGSVSINPLIPEKKWKWFCLEGVEYKGRNSTVIYDGDGSKYQVPPGLSLYVDGKRISYREDYGSLKGKHVL